MRRTIVRINQVTLHGVVVVGVASGCGTWHHCRHVGIEKTLRSRGRGLILQSAGIVGCWRGSAVLKPTRNLSGTSILRVRYSTRLVSRRQGKLDRVSVQAFTDWRHSIYLAHEPCILPLRLFRPMSPSLYILLTTTVRPDPIQGRFPPS
jgi:hypothetical protein